MLCNCMILYLIPIGRLLHCILVLLIVGLLYDGILEVVFVVVLVHYNTLLVEDRMDVYSWILHGG